LINATSDGYAALGFGNSMTGSDIMIVKFNGANTPTVYDTKGEGE
jgi:hypothetical protein